jgi:hypothetical protein
MSSEVERQGRPVPRILLVLIIVVALVQVVRIASEHGWLEVQGPYAGLNSDDVLKEAVKLELRMAESNRPKPVIQTKGPLITKDEVQQAKGALQRIVNFDPANAERARQLLVSIGKDEDEGRRAMQAAIDQAKKDDVAGRVAFAKQYEKLLLSSSVSATVTTSGPKSTIIRIVAPLSKSEVYRIATSPTLQSALREKAFSKLIVDDGYEWSSTVNFK